MNLRILILGNNADLASLLAYPLESRGFLCRIEPLSSKPSALRRWEKFSPQLLVVDGGARVPGPVLGAVQGLRSTRRVPAFLLLPALKGRKPAIAPVQDWDDSLAKPFDVREFLARVDVLVRRFYGPLEEVYRVGDLVLDLDRHEVRAGERAVRLSAKEFILLSVLMQKAGRVLSRRYLLQSVWGMEGELTTRAVDMCVCRLRGKLGGAGNAIETVAQFGYRLRA